MSTRRRRRIRLEVMERDLWTCQKCGKPATDAGHIVADFHRGPYTPDNLQAECTACNRGDGHRIATTTAPTPRAWSY